MPTIDNQWSNSWNIEVNPEPSPPDAFEQNLVREAKERFKICMDWEAPARLNFEYDYKFANGDTHNKFQWDDDIRVNRELEGVPCLTVNKTAQHNLMVINDSKQNKPGIRIRPVGDEASYDAAQVFQEIVYHIEYISNAENIYDSAMTFQVEAGMGYWRVNTDYIDDTSFDQEIYIRRIKDPRSVYLDPNINEIDGSDAWYGFIFDDMPRDLFRAKYPEFAAIARQSVLGETESDGWITKNNVRVCEYYRKTQKKDKLVHFVNPNGFQVQKRLSELDELEKLMLTEAKQDKENWQYQERRILIDDVQWYKIAGDRIIDKGPWLGRYIPIVRLPGVETVINGIMDRKGHTRALIDPQRMYNWNASADVQYGALQTMVPWIAPSAAIEGFEEYYKTANTVRHSYLPYNHIDEDGNPIPAPSRPLPPQPSPAYVQRMEISMNEMMQASGQFQAQFGEAENAKSGVAINARQRQGDRATYHFLDNQAMAIRFTGKIIIDLVPKIYDTKRVMRISTRDGTVMNVTVDPNAEKDLQQVDTDERDKEEKIKEIIFNPNVGTYDIQSDTGPSYATRRMEAFNALTQMANTNKEFMNIGGDLVFKVADFPEADILAQRWRRAIPPSILGEAPDANTEAAMNAAADQIQKLTGLVQQQSQQLADRAKEFELKERELELKGTVASVSEIREDFKAISDRIAKLGNSGPAFSLEQVQPLIQQAIREALGTPDLAQDNMANGHDQGTPIEPVKDKTNAEGVEEPPVEGAVKGADGQWYVTREGQHYRVE